MFMFAVSVLIHLAFYPLTLAVILLFFFVSISAVQGFNILNLSIS